MKTILKKITWLSGMETRWGNGYVIIPKGHPAHGKHYDEIEVDVHGGLTFAELASDLLNWPEITEEDKDGWVVGFDTTHYADTLKKWPKEAVQKEVDNLAAQLEKS